MDKRIPLPLTVSCFSKIQIGFTFLVPAHLGSSRKRAVKRVCVCDQLKKIPMQMFIMERYKHAYTVYQYLLAF